MKSIFDATIRAELLARVDRVNAESPRKFGRMRSDQMLYHVNQFLGAFLGDVPTTFGGSTLKAAIMRTLVLSPMPIPPGKGVSPPEFIASGTYDIESEKNRFKDIIERIGARATQTNWPVSPAFGPMTGPQYGKLGYKEADHHFRQFGV
jgi:hypothetical protein